MSATMSHMKVQKGAQYIRDRREIARSQKKGEEKQKSNGHSKQMQNSKQKTIRQNTKYASNHFPNGSSKETVSVCYPQMEQTKTLKVFVLSIPHQEIASIKPCPFTQFPFNLRQTSSTYATRTNGANKHTSRFLSFQFHTRQPPNQILSRDKMSTQLVPNFEHVYCQHKWSK